MPKTPPLFLPCNTGFYAWAHPIHGTGAFQPARNAPPTVHGKRPARANPWKFEPGGDLITARIFVGLYVKGKPKFKQSHIVNFVKKHWKREASFIAQDGLWTDSGKIGAEKSVQIIILNTFGLPQEDFMEAIGRLAEGLRVTFKQELVIAELQRNGLTIGTIFANP